jgi:hypothetical protein
MLAPDADAVSVCVTTSSWLPGASGAVYGYDISRIWQLVLVVQSEQRSLGKQVSNFTATVCPAACSYTTAFVVQW